MEENSKVEIDKSLLKELYKMANMEMPEDISDDSLMNVVKKIKNHDTTSEGNKEQSSEGQSTNSSRNILVIDDIGVVTYQIRVTLENLGYNVQVAKDIFNGLNAFIHSSFKYVVMDLFVSTEQEGYTLLNETKKIITQNNLDTKIIIITASNKAENKVRCLNGGADYFLKKDAGWQDKLIELIDGNSDTLEVAPEL